MNRLPRLTALVAVLAFLDLAMWFAAVPLLPRWEAEAGLSKDQAGMVVSAYSLAVIVASLPVGALVDRLGARRMTAGATLLFAAATPFLAFADSFGELVALRAAQGLFSAVSWTAGIAWMVNELSSANRPRGLAAVNIAASSASVAGPVIGGPLVQAIGLTSVAFVYAAVIAIVLAVVIRQPEPVSRGPAEGHLPAHRALALSRSEPRLAASFIAIVFAAGAAGVVQLLAPLHLADRGVTDAGVGWVFTAGAVLAIGAVWLVARNAARFGAVRLTTLLGAGVGVVALLFVTPLPLAGYIAATIAVTIVTASLFVLIYPLCAAGAEAAGVGQGVAMGALNTLWAVGALIAPLGAGALAERAGDPAAFTCVVAASAVATLALVRAGRAAPDRTA